jgi:serine/threonine protein kinase
VIGKTIGPYQVVAKLGEGGMGEVYRATDLRLKREVALKVLPERFTSDPERLIRFQREAEVLARLSHPNIAAIYGLVYGRLSDRARPVRARALVGEASGRRATPYGTSTSESGRSTFKRKRPRPVLAMWMKGQRSSSRRRSRISLASRLSLRSGSIRL